MAPEPVCRQNGRKNLLEIESRFYSCSAFHVFTVVAELSQLPRHTDFRISRNVTVSVMVLLFLVRISATFFRSSGYSLFLS
jgi:hypothetical protein